MESKVLWRKIEDTSLYCDESIGYFDTKNVKISIPIEPIFCFCVAIFHLRLFYGVFITVCTVRRDMLLLWIIYSEGRAITYMLITHWYVMTTWDNYLLSFVADSGILPTIGKSRSSSL